MQGIRNTTVLLSLRVFLVLFVFYPFTEVRSQQNFYDTDLLPPSFHKGRREALRNLLPEGSCAVLFSNPVRNRSNDVDYQYTQDPDFYYLTGLTEPHSVLMIFKDPVRITGREVTEVIFVQDRDPHAETWNGKRLGITGVSSRLGFTTVFLNKEFADMMPDLKPFHQVLAKLPFDIDSSPGKRLSLNSLVATFRERAGMAGKTIAPQPLLKALAQLREIKSPEELVLLQKAIDMTLLGLAEAIRSARPGMTEYQAQAIVEYYFKHHGAEYPGYGSISGGGENSCVLHYVTNRKTLSDGDMLLMDMGAEYHGYTADVTRTIPVNGKFSPEQKAVYNLVLSAQLAGIAQSRPGNNFYDPGKEATRIIAKGLVDLGIAASENEVKKYFNHGTSHYLGLEVHDPGTYGALKPGMVITVEPGIYIPEGSPCDKKWWNIGVRIEDDILITDNEPVVMSGALAKTVEDLERLMQEESLFNKVK